MYSSKQIHLIITNIGIVISSKEQQLFS